MVWKKKGIVQLIIFTRGKWLLLYWWIIKHDWIGGSSIWMLFSGRWVWTTINWKHRYRRWRYTRQDIATIHDLSCNGNKKNDTQYYLIMKFGTWILTVDWGNDWCRNCLSGNHRINISGHRRRRLDRRYHWGLFIYIYKKKYCVKWYNFIFSV